MQEIDGARLERALTQRILLVQWRKVETVCMFEVLGTRGITYDVEIGDYCSCSCPDFEQRGEQYKCKHILFVLCKLLGRSQEFARKTSFNAIQVEQWLQDAPVARLSINQDEEYKINQEEFAALVTGENVTKIPKSPQVPQTPKISQCPLEDDPCPICYDDFQKGESILYCSEQCGHNVHSTCYKRWYEYRKKQGNSIPICVFCRATWKTNKIK